jgi:arabinose-5-phosphate isomerase
MEAAAIAALVPRLDEAFDRAVSLVAGCRGRIILTGMGKSGIISRKIAATLTGTGTPAFFLHPAEAIHGDLGAIQADDVVIALSHSGETEEILRLLKSIKRIGAALVVLTGSPTSNMGRAADAVLDCGVLAEACPLGLAPTASTTAGLAMGDALAMTVLQAKGFRVEDFVSLHPGGKIGKQFMRVSQLMHAGQAMPRVTLDTPLPDVIYEISRKGLGMTCVIDEGGTLMGVITDGDLRRHMGISQDLLTLVARDVMSTRPVVTHPDVMAAEALGLLEQRKITSIVALSPAGAPEGVLHLHDLWDTELT